MDEMDEIRLEFIAEGREMIEDSVPKLIELQQDSEALGDVDIETLNSIFRTFHSIKGSAGYLGFERISKVTHAAETLLDLFRQGERTISHNDVDLLLEGCDFMQHGLDTVESESTDESLAEMAEILHAKLDGAAGGDGAEPEEPTAEAIGDSETGEVAEETPELTFDNVITDELRQQFVTESGDLLGPAEQVMLRLAGDLEVLEEVIPEVFRQIHSFKGNCGFMEMADLQQVSHSFETVLDCVRVGSVVCTEDALELFLKTIDVLTAGVADVAEGGEGRIENVSGWCAELEALVPSGDAAAENAPESEEAPAAPPAAEAVAPVEPVAAPAAEAPAQEAAKAKASGANRPNLSKQNIRVDLTKLDDLNNLVGELVIAQAMVTNNPDLKGMELENFERAAGHLDRIVRDLQDTAMSVRMIPIAGTFRKMIRLVHDLSSKFGKKANLEMRGEDTEIDKTVAEMIGDPLVHIVRNSLDHGLERPDVRAEAGKNETGTIRLEALHEGGEIWITISDDGHGLDRERILKKARENGIVGEEADTMSDRDVFQLIFEAGFSTAETVSDVSGRGVGMDVVRKNIEKLKGSIDVESKAGHGTTIILRIPLTLAIIEGMLVRVGTAKYTIPILAVNECICTDGGNLVTPMEGDEVVKVRDEMIPIVRLADLHCVHSDCKDIKDGVLVIVNYKNTPIAVLVDEVLGQHQTVIKALPRYMGEVRSVSGCTIMGDGDVSMIVDPGGLLAMAKSVCA